MNKPEKRAPTPDELAMAARFKIARKAAGFKTSEDFALHFGIKEPTARSHESGRGIKKAIQIYSKHLGVRFEWLRDGTGAMTEAEQKHAFDVAEKFLTLRDHDRQAVEQLIQSLSEKATRDAPQDGEQPGDQHR